MTPGDLIQGRYRLEEALGSGGMATVWRAIDERLHRPVALKCLSPTLSSDPTFLVRFFSEAQQVARLSHPNVVRVLDFGDDEGCHYLVMEYVPGGSLEALTGEPFEPNRAFSLIEGAARGAGAAHATGLVHRDLKPANIMLSDQGDPKVGDFGIAVMAAQERLTATGTAIGSPSYVSPEQASGRPVGPPSDVYSLGVVLYELLTGRRPFEAENATALAIAHVEQAPTPPSEIHPGLPEGADELVMRCLEKDPAKRFDDGNELAGALASLAREPNTTGVYAVTPLEPDEDDVETTTERNGKRVAIVGALAAVFAGLLIAGVSAFGSGDDGTPAEDRAAASVDQGSSINGVESPSPKEDEYDDEGTETYAASGATPTPSPSSDQTPRAAAKTAAPEKTEEPEEEPEDDPTPTSEPTTEPTSEPTTEPTAAP